VNRGQRRKEREGAANKVAPFEIVAMVAFIVQSDAQSAVTFEPDYRWPPVQQAPLALVQ